MRTFSRATFLEQALWGYSNKIIAFPKSVHSNRCILTFSCFFFVFLNYIPVIELFTDAWFFESLQVKIIDSSLSTPPFFKHKSPHKTKPNKSVYSVIVVKNCFAMCLQHCSHHCSGGVAGGKGRREHF